MNVIPLHPIPADVQASWDRLQAALADHRREQAQKRLRDMGVLA